MSMYRRITVVLMLFVLSANLAANRVTIQLSQYLNSFRTYQAHFMQKTYSGTKMIAHATGIMWLDRPRRLRWEQQSPSKQLLIVNNRTVWNYNADLMQATYRRLNDQELNSAGVLLLNNADLNKLFVVKSLSASSDIKAFALTPKQHSSFESVDLYFKRQQLVEMQTTDHLGQRTEYFFKSIHINPKLSKALFRFKPPHGVDVLRSR